jgi:hypothetical protein
VQIPGREGDNNLLDETSMFFKAPWVLAADVLRTALLRVMPDADEEYFWQAPGDNGRVYDFCV